MSDIEYKRMLELRQQVAFGTQSYMNIPMEESEYKIWNKKKESAEKELGQLIRKYVNGNGKRMPPEVLALENSGKTGSGKW